MLSPMITFLLLLGLCILGFAAAAVLIMLSDLHGLRAVKPVSVGMILLIAVCFFFFFYRFYFTGRFLGGSVRDPLGEHDASLYTEEELLSFLDTDEVVLQYQPAAESLQALDTTVSYVNDTVLVFLQPSAGEREKREVINLLNGTLVGLDNMANCLQIRVDAGGLDALDALCRQAEELPQVAAAFCDLAAPVESAMAYDDPFGVEEADWSGGVLDSQPVYEGMLKNNWAWEAVGMPQAWDYTDYFTEITVGVSDLGFNLNHEDLKDVDYTVLTSDEDAETDREEGLENTYHASKVLSILSATADNGVGLAGIVQKGHFLLNSFANQLPFFVKTESEQAYQVSYSQLTTDTSRLLREGARVINYSWIFSSEAHDGDVIDRYGRMVSAYVFNTLVKGQLRDPSFDFLLVAAAGNGVNNAMQEPMDAKNGLSLQAVDRDNCVEPWSADYSKDDILDRIVVVSGFTSVNGINVAEPGASYGDTVDILAPCRNIYTVDFDPIAFTGMGNEYTRSSDGTSYAAPFVTGAAALVWSINPSLDGPGVVRILLESAPEKLYAEIPSRGWGAEIPALHIGRAVTLAAAGSVSITEETEGEDGETPPETQDSSMEDSGQDSEEETDVLLESLRRMVEADGGTAPLGETVTDAAQYPNLSGLIGADIADYDGDGRKELLVIRLFENDSDRVYLNARVEVFEEENGEAVSASALEFPLPEVYSEYSTTSYDFFSIEKDGVRSLCLDYLMNFNAQAIGVIRFGYDGASLHLVDGSEPSEFAGSSILDRPVEDEALQSLCGIHFGNPDRGGWSQVADFDWESANDYDNQDEYVDKALTAYGQMLQVFGLRDPEPRSMYTHPLMLDGWDLDSLCLVRPSAHYVALEGAVINLCGVCGTDSGESRHTYTCWSEGGYLE